MSDMDLSIVLVSWSSRDFLARCLESVYATLPSPACEVLVVDNASRDGTAELVRARFPQTTLIENDTNVGFARANNQALARCRGRYVLLLNPDTELRRGALVELMRVMETNPGAGAAGARLLNPDGSLQISCYPLPTLGREFWRLFHLDYIKRMSQYDIPHWDTQSPRRVEVIQGACILLRQQALEAVGALDDSFFMYSEEVDLCYRLRRAGWSIYWTPAAQVVHYDGQSTRLVPAEMFIQLYQGKLLYFRKHGGWLAAQVYRVILLLAAVTRLMLTPLAYLEHRPAREKHLTLARLYSRLLASLLAL